MLTEKTSFTRQRHWFIAVSLSIVLTAPEAHARLRSQVTTSGTGDQSVLAVGFDDQGHLLTEICQKRPCSPERGTQVLMPESLKNRLSQAEIRLVPLGLKRHAVWIRISDGQGEHAWNWLGAAPLRQTPPLPQTPPQALVLFSDWTGTETPNQKTPVRALSLSAANAQGERSLLLGEERPQLSLCGRKAPFDAKILDPISLSFVPAKLQLLDSKERAQATHIQAIIALSESASRIPLELTPSWASTGKLPQAGSATDQGWFEARKNDGYGEFLVLEGPEIPLTSLLLTLPKEGGTRRGPSAFWVASQGALVHVELPKSGTPGELLQVAFPTPISGQCVALVLDHTEGATDTTEVGFASVTAQALSLPSLEELILGLGKEGPEQQQAISLLVALGKPALTRLTLELGKLNEQQLSAACDVLDRFSCADTSYPFSKLLANRSALIAERARARLRMCGPAAASGLTQAFSEAKQGSESVPVAAELAAFAPETAVLALAPRLTGKSSVRQELRASFARAARAPASATAVRKVLAQDDLSPALSLEVLRALGPYANTFLPEVGKAYTRARRTQDFESRFLLLEPAGYLEASYPQARADLSVALTTKDWRLRAQAAASVRQAGRFAPALVRLLGDEHQRVRQAALGVILGPSAKFAEPAVLGLLRDDPWPLVRASAAKSLGALKGAALTDSALQASLTDASPEVRASVAEALGARGSATSAQPLLARLEDQEEAVEVRIASAAALAEMCASTALNSLTRRAQALSDPTAPSDAQMLGRAALRALVRLNPSDLQKRLAPLKARTAPPAVRAAAGRAASSSVTRCQTTRVQKP